MAAEQLQLYRLKKPILLDPELWMIPQIEQAPMLALSAAMKIRKERAFNSMVADFSVGEPVLTPQIISKIKDICAPADLETTSPIVRELAAWTIETAENMVKYSPKGGSKDMRTHFLKNTPAGSFSEKELTVISNGPSIAREHAIETIKASVPAGNETVEVFYNFGGDDGSVIELAHNHLKDHKYVILHVKDSAALPIETKLAITQLASRGKVFIIDESAGDGIPEGSLGTESYLKNITLTITTSPLSRITGVSGLFGHEKLIKAIQERHTNLYGTPSSSEMRFHLKLAEFMENSEKLKQLGNLDLAELEALPANHPAFKNIIQLFQSAVIYLTTLDEFDFMEFQNLKSGHIDQLEKLTSRFYNLVTPEKIAVIKNGGARGDLGGDMVYFDQKTGSNIFLFPAPCWSYRDLRRRSDWIFIYATDAFTVNGFDEQVMSKLMEEHKNENATIFITLGPQNPTGKVIPADAVKRIMILAQEWGINVIVDTTYAFGTRKGVHLYSPGQAALDLQLASKPLTSTTFSKNFFAPGIRLAADLTDEPMVARDLESQRNTDEINPIAVELMLAMTGSEETVQLMEMARGEMTYRTEKIKQIARDSGRNTGDPDGGYYIMVESKALKLNPKLAMQLLPLAGAAAMEVRSMMNGGPASEGYLRFAAAGFYETHEQFEQAVKFFLEVDDWVADKIQNGITADEIQNALNQGIIYIHEK